VVNGRIYALGGAQHGFMESELPLATVEEYDPITNMWTTKALLPTPRFTLAAVVVNERIYAIGGSNEEEILATVEEYNPLFVTPTTTDLTTVESFPFPKGPVGLLLATLLLATILVRRVKRKAR